MPRKRQQPQIRVLFLDEKSRVSELMPVVAKRLGAETDLAETGTEAAKFLDAVNNYGCAILEPYVQKFLGREPQSPMRGLVKRLGRAGIPVLMLTDYRKEDLARFGFKMGGDYAAYIGKPYYASEVLRKLRIVLKK